MASNIKFFSRRKAEGVMIRKLFQFSITSPNIQDSNAVEIKRTSFHNLTHQATWVQWTFLVLVSTLSITVSSLAVGLTIRSLGAATKLINWYIKYADLRENSSRPIPWHLNLPLCGSENTVSKNRRRYGVQNTHACETDTPI